MKFTEAQYLDAMDGYFGPDDETSNHQVKLVKTRKEHQCMGTDPQHDEEMIPAGSMAICETAIHVDMGRVSCYVCLPCADEWVSEIYPSRFVPVLLGVTRYPHLVGQSEGEAEGNVLDYLDDPEVQSWEEAKELGWTIDEEVSK